MKEFEQNLQKQNIKLIAGIDEAGRGPVAGPVVAAAVILNPKYEFKNKVTDSKKLTKVQREKAYSEIIENALSVGVGIVDVTTIDKINILEAAKLAMIKAVNNLTVNPEHLLIDALNLDINIPQTKIIKGDLKSISIASASIIAKVSRDKIMLENHQLYPVYGFDTHQGYLTKKHRDAIEEFGPSPIHRTTFKPISNYFK